ncbi:MAG: superinfection exclusion B family protein [Endomicrobiales bacterium]|nr:superinfection exclusion B family protein [Endomicrobiales bacterium]
MIDKKGNMIESITKLILEFVKLAPRYLFALGAASAFLLFGPEPILKYLSIFDFTHTYRTWISILFILALATSITTIAVESISIVKRCITDWIFLKNMRKHLYVLTEEEKQILRFYIAKQSKTNVLRIDDGIVQGLAFKGIIYQSTSLGTMLEGFAYNINDFAWKYLNKHPNLLQGNTNTYRTDKIERMYE